MHSRTEIVIGPSFVNSDVSVSSFSFISSSSLFFL